MMELTDEQKRIINQEGNIAVSASAGTGKTFTMIEKIKKDLEHNDTHKQIAAITFTIKASREISDKLSKNVNNQYIGTNNSFVIREIIKPFMKDVYGFDYDLDFDTNYNIKVSSFEEVLRVLKNQATIPSYENLKKNLIFELAYKIITDSLACKKYLKSKYFKIYIDEYQDCDEDMHRLFMYLSNELSITTFVIGDEKQSIYTWRGAYPEAFKGILESSEFTPFYLRENFRSVKQIQNYSNILNRETRHLFEENSMYDNVLFIENTAIDIDDLLEYIDNEMSLGVLNYSNENAQLNAELFSNSDLSCTYIPRPPVYDITTESGRICILIAKYLILDKYSVYTLLSELSSLPDEYYSKINQLNELLISMKQQRSNKKLFFGKIRLISDFLNNGELSDTDLRRLFETISDEVYYPVFNLNNYEHVSMTFHSSKGLEYDQIILFAKDYPLNTKESIYNHYVASTRAREKLIIIIDSTYNSQKFIRNINNIIASIDLNLEEVVTYI